MANNGRSIEELKNDALKIKNELDDLKKDTEKTDQEKKDEAENLKTKAKDVKEALENMQIEEDDATKKAIETTLDEIDVLYNEIKSQTESQEATNTTGGNNGQGNASNPNNSSNQQASTGNKNVFEKAWDWVKDQWRDVQNKDKRKNEPGKNTFRTLGFAATGVGGVVLAYKGIKKLFGWGNDEESEGTSPKSEKKFWDRWYGKALKWGLITAGGIFGIKWLGEKLDLRGTDKDKPTDDESSEVKYKAFDELPEETKEIYNKLGDKVDQVYEKINQRELDAGFQDSLTMDRTAREVEGGNLNYTGIIPFCIDNKFGSVEELLGQNNSLKWNAQIDVRSVLNWIRNTGRDALEFFAKNYLSKFGFGPVNYVGDKLAEAIERRAANDESKQKEIKLFYRQSIRMERYFFEKKKQLEEKIIENNGIASKEDILKDDELYENVVLNHSDFKSFLTGGIATAITILEKYGLLDDTVGEDTKKIVEEIDEKRDSITGNSSEDIAKIIYEKEDTAEISGDEKEKLKTACTKMKEDIDKTIVPALKHSPIECYEILLGGSDNTEIKEFIKKGGVSGQLSECGNNMNTLASKIDQLDTKGVKKLAENLNIFLALKKEIMLGADTIGDEDYNFWGALYKSCCSANNQMIHGIKEIFEGNVLDGLVDIGLAAPFVIFEYGVIQTAYGVIQFGKGRGTKTLFCGLKKVAFPLTAAFTVGRRGYNCAKFGAKSVGRASSGIKIKINPRTFSDANTFNKFIEDIKLRKVPLSTASEEIRSYLMKNSTQKADELIRNLGLDYQSADDVLHIEKKLIDKAFPDSENLRKLKADKALYERAIKSYHSCNEVKEFIDGQGGDVNSLKTALDNHEQQLIQEARRTPTEFSEKCKASWDRSSLKQEFETERSKLQSDVDIKKTAMEQEEKKAGLDREKRVKKANRELTAAKKKLNQLNKIEENVKQAMTELEKTNPRRLETALDNLLGDTEKIVKKLGGSTSHGLVDLMKDIDVLNGLVDTVKDANGNKVFNNVDDLIKKLNGNYIDELKNTYNVKFSSGAVENRLKTIAEDISEIRARNAIGLADDTLEALKRVFKISSKISKVTKIA